MPLHVSSTCANRQEVKIPLRSLWYHHTYRCNIVEPELHNIKFVAVVSKIVHKLIYYAMNVWIVEVKKQAW